MILCNKNAFPIVFFMAVVDLVSLFLLSQILWATDISYTPLFTGLLLAFTQHPAWCLAPPVDIDREGHQVSKATLNRLCPQESPACRQNQGIQTLTFYQPAGRFWLFQGIEALLVLVLSGALVAVTFWFLRRLQG